MKRTGHYKHIGQNVTCIACALFFSSGSLAQTIENDVSKTTSTISNASTTSVENTLTMQALASQWNLDVEEYSRYEKLMQGPLGKWNPHIDPLLALGMFAQSPEEERRFAERYAQQEFELTQRAIHFQQTYRAAFNRLYPNTSVINDALLQPYFQHRQAKLGTNTPSSQLSQRLFKNGDTLMYFPKQGSQKRLREICHAAGGKVVHHADFIAVLNQEIRQMRSDKTCAACD